MPRSLLLVASLAAVILAVGAVFLVGSGGRTSVPTPAPTVAAVATPSAAPTPSPSPSSSPGPSPYPLAAGEAWIALGGPDNNVTLIRPDGTGAHDILSTIGTSVANPAWSPDGQRVVFEGNGDHGSQLWVAEADGTGAHQLTPTPPGCPNGLCTEAVQPAWSPDGKTIAYIAPQHDGGGYVQTSLMLVDVTSGKTTEVYTTKDTSLNRPTWSPDSRRIALEIDRYDGLVEASPIKDSLISLIDTQATDRTPKALTDPKLLAGYPSWHPTDDRITFRTNRLDTNTSTLLDGHAASNVYTIDANGKGMTAVTHYPVGGAIVRAPSWTPDGRILFSKLADPTALEVLRVIGAGGTGEVSATGTTITIGEGRWRPTP